MGLAVYNSITLDIRFPPCCYKKLLSPPIVPTDQNTPVGICSVTTDDLCQIMPVSIKLLASYSLMLFYSAYTVFLLLMLFLFLNMISLYFCNPSSFFFPYGDTSPTLQHSSALTNIRAGFEVRDRDLNPSSAIYKLHDLG